MVIRKVNTGFWICFSIYVFMFFVDLWSTLINWDLVKHLEANPLFRIGGLPLITAFNIVIMAGVWFWYTRSNSGHTRFVLMWGMVMIIMLRFVVSYQNYQIYLDPPSLEVARSFTVAQKNDFVLKELVLVNVLPMFQALFTFWFWKKDHDHGVKFGDG